MLGNTIGFTKKEYIINSFKLDMKFMNKLALISAFYPYAHYKEIFIRKCCGPPKGEKADPVYPGYGHNPADPEDTVAIHRIRRILLQSIGYM